MDATLALALRYFSTGASMDVAPHARARRTRRSERGLHEPADGAGRRDFGCGDRGQRAESLVVARGRGRAHHVHLHGTSTGLVFRAAAGVVVCDSRVGMAVV